VPDHSTTEPKPKHYAVRRYVSAKLSGQAQNNFIGLGGQVTPYPSSPDLPVQQWFMATPQTRLGGTLGDPNPFRLGQASVSDRLSGTLLDLLEIVKVSRYLRAEADGGAGASRNCGEDFTGPVHDDHLVGRLVGLAIHTDL